MTSVITHKSFTFETVRVNDLGKVIVSMKKEALYYSENLGGDVTMDMVCVPAGSFMMGSPEGEYKWQAQCKENPQHLVNIPTFYISKYPVTRAQYKLITGENPSHFKTDGKLPVETVSAYDAQNFCALLEQKTGNKYQLPSEAQWEYACRAETTTMFNFGNMITTDLANFESNQTSIVGIFPPNSFGLYDMHGNVWEWCLDNFHENYLCAPSDGSAWTSANDHSYLREHKIDLAKPFQERWVRDDSHYYRNQNQVRGGSWYSTALNCRSAERFHSGGRSEKIGFRVVYMPIIEKDAINEHPEPKPVSYSITSSYPLESNNSNLPTWQIKLLSEAYKIPQTFVILILVLSIFYLWFNHEETQKIEETIQNSDEIAR